MAKQDVMNKATEYIDAIASKLGVASEHVYGLLVKQQVVLGIVNISLGILFITLTIAILVFVTKAIKKGEVSGRKYYERADNIYGKFLLGMDGALPYVVSFLGLALFIAGISCVVTGGLWAFNPEYYAIKEVLDVIKGN